MYVNNKCTKKKKIYVPFRRHSRIRVCNKTLLLGGQDGYERKKMATTQKNPKIVNTFKGVYTEVFLS